jgi:ferrous iron transport protein B
MPLAIEGDAPVTAKIKAAIAADKKSAFEGYLNTCEKGVLKTGEAKFAWIDGLLEGRVTSKSNTRKLGKFDRMITHRIWGKPVVVLIVLFGLIGSFIPAYSSNAFDSMVWCRSSSGNCCNPCSYDSSYVDYIKNLWTWLENLYGLYCFFNR